MPIGSRRNRGGDEYVFIDGKAMTAQEAVRIELTAEDSASVPGQAEAASVPGASEAAGKKDSSKKWSLKRSFEQLNTGSAFDMNEDFAITMQQTMRLQADDRRSMRMRVGVMLALLVIAVLLSLCIGGGSEIGKFYSPLTVIKSYSTWIYLAVGNLFHLDYYDALAPFRAAQEIEGYGPIIARVSTTFGTALCGLLLSLAGMMYQNVFKNPLASPSMLGVSVGVRMGTIILVLLFGELALDMQATRYVFCYIGGVIILLGVVGFSKLMAGRGKINVADMLIAGTVFSQLLQAFSQFFLSYIMTDDQYEIFYEITSGMRSSFEWYANLVLVIVFLIAVVPIFMTRFRLNTIAFDDSEAKLLGVNPETTRVFVLIAGTLMILAAQISVGVISLVSLVVPFLVRYIVGSEFGKQLIGNLILGPLLLIVCQDVCSLIPFMDTGLPLTTAVAFVGLPLYIWMTALGKRGWE